MTNQITAINNHDLAVKEIEGQRVVTFKEVDELHERLDGTAKKRFYENSDHFIENQDFYTLKPADFLKSEKRTLGISKKDVPNRGKVYLTMVGYLMLVKSLTDDLAWHIQRQLVNSYFLSKTAPETQVVPIEQFQAMQKSISDLTSNISFIKSEIFKMAYAPSNSEWKRKINAKIIEISKETESSCSSTLNWICLKMKEKGYDIVKLIHQYEFENGLQTPCPTMEFLDKNKDVKKQFEILLDEMATRIFRNLPTHNNVETTNAYINKVQEELAEPIKVNTPAIVDPFKAAMQPLIEKYSDYTKGGNRTYRRVYAAMGVCWQIRQTRYKNEHKLKNQPKKMTLIENDKKLMKLYLDTINGLIAEA